MTPEEINWHIDLVKQRHHTLNLTTEQAEKVFRYEQDKGTYSDKHYFSAWEEWDYELTVFKEILTTEQFETFSSFLHESIHQYEQSLIREDNEESVERLYLEDLINFYQQHFLPALRKNPFIGFGWLLSERNKIEYLRKEYQRFLDDTKKEALTNHFRHYRTLKPNELKIALLRHETRCLFPDYGYFRHQMDQPTKAIADHLKTKLRHLPAETEKLLSLTFNELKEFNYGNTKKHYGESTGGWHVEIAAFTEEEEREERIMSFVLLDKEKYRS